MVLGSLLQAPKAATTTSSPTFALMVFRLVLSARGSRCLAAPERGRYVGGRTPTASRGPCGTGPALLTETTRMPPDGADLEHLSQVISQATAPAFLLGAMSGFLAVLIARFSRIPGRIRVLVAIGGEGPSRPGPGPRPPG